MRQDKVGKTVSCSGFLVHRAVILVRFAASEVEQPECNTRDPCSVKVQQYKRNPLLWLEIEWGFVVRSFWRGQMSLISSKS